MESKLQEPLKIFLSPLLTFLLVVLLLPGLVIAVTTIGVNISTGGTLTLEGDTYDTTLQAGTPSISTTYTLPAADGTSGDMLTTDGSGILSWAARAKIDLSNLSLVAINTSLISDTDSTDDLGSSSIYWANLYVDKIYLDEYRSIEYPNDYDLYLRSRGGGNIYLINGAPAHPYAVRFYSTAADTYLMPEAANLKVEGTIFPDDDSTYNLGTSSKYWANAYIDKLYLNSTAYLDGATAGKVNIVGSLEADDYYSGDGTQGTTTSAYYLCTKSNCSATCQVVIEDGLIVDCQ